MLLVKICDRKRWETCVKTKRGGMVWKRDENVSRSYDRLLMTGEEGNFPELGHKSMIRIWADRLVHRRERTWCRLCRNCGVWQGATRRLVRPNEPSRCLACSQSYSRRRWHKKHSLLYIIYNSQQTPTVIRRLLAIDTLSIVNTPSIIRIVGLMSVIHNRLQRYRNLPLAVTLYCQNSLGVGNWL